MSAGPSRNLAGLAVVCIVQFALDELGFRIGDAAGTAATIWPSSGFGLAVLVVFGTGFWPAVFAGSVLACLAVTGFVSTSLTFGAGHVLEAWVGARLVDRFAGGQTVFGRPHTILRFVAIAACVSAPLGATLGVAAPHVAGAGSGGWNAVPGLWGHWWFASLAGILIVAPFTSAWLSSLATRIDWKELGEALLVLGVLTAMCLVVFSEWSPAGRQRYPLEFVAVPVLLWAAFRLGGRGMSTAVLVLSASAVWATVNGVGPFARETARAGVTLVQAYTSIVAVTGIVLVALVAERRRAEAKLEALATTDSLTGLANHRRLLEVLRTEIARSQRTSRPFAVVFLDLDGLKGINDRYGHLAGSRALCRLGDALKRSCRAMDTTARYGGDEFAVVLPETAERGGQAVLARVSSRLASGREQPRLSVSGGVAVFPRDGESPTLLLRAADRLLYAAKAATSEDVSR